MHYVDRGHGLDPETGARMSDAAELVCAIWRHDDAGIWELHQDRPYTISKMSCWAALDRAIELAARGQIPARHAGRWRRERDAIHRYVENACWSERRGAYTFYAGTDELDASLAVALRLGYPGVRAGSSRRSPRSGRSSEPGRISTATAARRRRRIASSRAVSGKRRRSPGFTVTTTRPR